MNSILTSLINPVWADRAHTAINCFSTTTQFGDELLPFSASPVDPEAHGRAIFAAIINGEYGDIAEYIEPPPPLPSEQPTSTGTQTL